MSDDLRATDELRGGNARPAPRPDEMFRLLGGRIPFAAAPDGGGVSRIPFRARPELCHSGGVVQGGFVTGWIDSAMSHAVMHAAEGAVWPASLEIKVSFFRPVLPGQNVVAEGWIERMGRSIAFVAGRLVDEEGEVLATSTSTAKLLPVKRP